MIETNKKIRKISDLPEVHELENEHFPLVRKSNGTWLWAGNKVENILTYRQQFHYVDPRLFVLNSSQLLRQHLASEIPHVLYDVDAEEKLSYKLTIDLDGVLEVEIVDEDEEFFYSPDGEVLDFNEMFQKHLLADVEYHKVFDKRDSSYKWYRINFENEDNGPMFVIDFSSEIENEEILDFFENQELDYYHNEIILKRHMLNLFPHRVLNLEVNFGFEVEDGEISIVLEE